MNKKCDLEDLRWCSNCLSMSTRPRISFDEKGYCNACQWAEEKKKIDWDARKNKLISLLDSFRKNDNTYDCLVPVSGGKDGSYIAHQLKNVYNMNPLCVTIAPPLSLPLGDKNLQNFIDSGFSHITCNPSRDIMRALDKYGFVELGFPYYGWLTAITTAPLQIASKMNISLVCYAEDGEVEYGGAKEFRNSYKKSSDYAKKILLSDANSSAINSIKKMRNGIELFEFPAENQLNSLTTTHWSYFENWDPYRNYLVAKEFCGLEEAKTSNPGTFTNFAQNDQALYSLHTYLMYLKFGFGRANQDACIEIRRGAMDRSQAINLVNLYDGAYPEEFEELYLDYYSMDKGEFYRTIDRWANKSLFTSEGEGRYSKKFAIK